MEFTVEERKFIAESYTGVEAIKPPGRNMKRNAVQKLLHGSRYF
jgi:hypothetical protein